ncbi:TraY domain-containing protein [Sodalis endosymbiont of Spalangia cameroni]|uniref:TraY domain-containing protein n=1 Tax=Sodalis praecaptivus TaxID=1239307 RepID=UPI0031F8CFDE
MLRFDATLSEQINHAIAASGRSKTAECLVRLRHHLSLYPDFISQEVSDRDTITEK